MFDRNEGMKLYKLAAEPQNVQGIQGVVMPLPPPGPQQQPNQMQQQQPNGTLTPLDSQVAQFINQQKNNLPPMVRNALANPQQRAILIAMIEGMADPVNNQFLQRFVQFVKQMQGQQQRQQPHA